MIARLAQGAKAEGQKFGVGERVYVGKMPEHKSHFNSEEEASVLYTYCQVYGGTEAKDYALEFDDGSISSWYSENELTRV